MDKSLALFHSVAGIQWLPDMVLEMVIDERCNKVVRVVVALVLAQHNIHTRIPGGCYEKCLGKQLLLH